jgi:hypothetical protein
MEAQSLAGMIHTSTRVFHETDRQEGFSAEDGAIFCVCGFLWNPKTASA